MNASVSLFEQHEFSHGEYRLAYETVGEGMPFVLLHGILLDSHVNRALAVRIAGEGFRVILLDLLGHGRSEASTDPKDHRADFYAEQVLGLLDHLQLPRAVIGGVSLGCIVSLHVAARAPERVAGLFLEMPVMEWSAPWAALLLSPLLLAARFGRAGYVPFSRFMRKLPRPHRLDREWIAGLMNTLSMRPSVVAAILHGVLVGPIVPQELQRRALTMPALVLGHAGDKLHEFRDADVLSQQLPNARLLAARHILELRTSPERLWPQIGDFLREVQAQEEEQRERAKVRSQAQLRQMLVEEAREQLADNRQRFQVALAFAQIGAWELDPASGDIECTVQCKANYGLPPDAEFNERRLFEELIDPEDRQRVRQTMDQALAAHEHFEVDYRTTWPDGSQHWILVRGIGRHQADGSLAAVRGFTLDITHRKQRELEQQAIAAAEKQARQQSERAALAMDHFVTAVSHELRSPLNAILSWASLLRRSPDAAGVNRAAEVIDRNTRQLSHMVDDLLDGGAIATGKLSVKLEPVDVGALAGNVIEDMRMNAEAKGLRLVVDDLASCTVLGDVARLRQVLWNVLSNAMKFTPAGGEVRLAVRAQGAEVEVEVRDSGRGIEPQALERIFDRFQQYDNPGPGRVGGLGLGLWLVKNLVDLHHGSVGAHSEGAGRGATFRIRLPRYL
mgnify:CR=1 FL=1